MYGLPDVGSDAMSRLLVLSTATARTTNADENWSNASCTRAVPVGQTGVSQAGQGRVGGHDVGLIEALRIDVASHGELARSEGVQQRHRRVGLGETVRSEEHTSELQSLRHIVC